MHVEIRSLYKLAPPPREKDALNDRDWNPMQLTRPRASASLTAEQMSVSSPPRVPLRARGRAQALPPLGAALPGSLLDADDVWWVPAPATAPPTPPCLTLQP
jgi:hypothetical protein